MPKLHYVIYFLYCTTIIDHYRHSNNVVLLKIVESIWLLGDASRRPSLFSCLFSIVEYCKKWCCNNSLCCYCGCFPYFRKVYVCWKYIFDSREVRVMILMKNCVAEKNCVIFCIDLLKLTSHTSSHVIRSRVRNVKNGINQFIRRLITSKYML